ncbi:MAG: CopG family transcriptional regulator [bacterium]|nr:CopG family transcriptional regulator [bacterium]
MRTIQMTLDEDLVEAVDQMSAELQTSRSAFTRMVLRDALAKNLVCRKKSNTVWVVPKRMSLIAFYQKYPAIFNLKHINLPCLIKSIATN